MTNLLQNCRYDYNDCELHYINNHHYYLQYYSRETGISSCPYLRISLFIIKAVDGIYLIFTFRHLSGSLQYHYQLELEYQRHDRWQRDQRELKKTAKKYCSFFKKKLIGEMCWYIA